MACPLYRSLQNPCNTDWINFHIWKLILVQCKCNLRQIWKLTQCFSVLQGLCKPLYCNGMNQGVLIIQGVHTCQPITFLPMFCKTFLVFAGHPQNCLKNHGPTPQTHVYTLNCIIKMQDTNFVGHLISKICRTAGYLRQKCRTILQKAGRLATMGMVSTSITMKMLAINYVLIKLSPPLQPHEECPWLAYYTLLAEQRFEEQEKIWRTLLSRLKRDSKVNVEGALKVSDWLFSLQIDGILWWYLYLFFGTFICF